MAITKRLFGFGWLFLASLALGISGCDLNDDATSDDDAGHGWLLKPDQTKLSEPEVRTFRHPDPATSRASTERKFIDTSSPQTPRTSPPPRDRLTPPPIAVSSNPCDNWDFAKIPTPTIPTAFPNDRAAAAAIATPAEHTNQIPPPVEAISHWLSTTATYRDKQGLRVVELGKGGGKRNAGIFRVEQDAEPPRIVKIGRCDEVHHLLKLRHAAITHAKCIDDRLKLKTQSDAPHFANIVEAARFSKAICGQILELAPGAKIETLIDETTLVFAPDAATIFERLGERLANLHRLGWTQRDAHWNNVFFARDTNIATFIDNGELRPCHQDEKNCFDYDVAQLVKGTVVGARRILTDAIVYQINQQSDDVYKFSKKQLDEFLENTAGFSDPLQRRVHYFDSIAKNYAYFARGYFRTISEAMRPHFVAYTKELCDTISALQIPIGNSDFVVDNNSRFYNLLPEVKACGHWLR